MSDVTQDLLILAVALGLAGLFLWPPALLLCLLLAVYCVGRAWWPHRGRLRRTRRRPDSGPCPFCGAASDRWCGPECPAVDPKDYR